MYGIIFQSLIIKKLKYCTHKRIPTDDVDDEQNDDEGNKLKTKEVNKISAMETPYT